MAEGKRTLSLDVFRGMTVAGMILVNNPGSWSHIYRPLSHAQWHGLRGADLVFPFFLFIMGVSVALSTGSRLGRGDDMSPAMAHVLKRTAILFALGLFLNAFPFYPADRLVHLRIPGVLQRIALVYCLTALVALRPGPLLERAAIPALLAGYWLLCALVPVPGTGVPSVEPGANLAAWLDRLVMDGHLWTVTGTWDPEGILSSLSAVATGLLGLEAGRVLLSGRSMNRKIVLLLAAGTILAAAGVMWHRVFPVNKSLWTGSYVLVTGGIASVALGVLVYLVDVRGFRRWALPFRAFGMNSLVVFFLSSLLARTLNVITVHGGGGAVSLGSFLYGGFFAPHLSPVNASLAWALCHVLLWLAVAGLMYRKRFFVKL